MFYILDSQLKEFFIINITIMKFYVFKDWM